jgi:hypothetical protein
MAEKKEKEKSPRDLLIEKIEQMTPGQEYWYRLSPMYGKDIIVVFANKNYPGKRISRFAVQGADEVNGKPGPHRRTYWESNKAKPIALWLIGRTAEPIS